jgi:large subunit ribosomal protein L10e
MAKLMRASAWRRLERAYTRKSKYRKLNYIKAVPTNKIVKFDMGDTQKKFDYTLYLRSKENLQIRHNALESARKSSNRVLELKCGKLGYHMKVRTYPHHVLRNNPLASGAGADRMSTGMAASFGKTVGLAARIKKGQIVVEVSVDTQHLQLAKLAMDRARYKFPGSYYVEVIKNN